MEIDTFLTQVHDQVIAAAALGDDRTREIAASLSAAVGPAVQLAILGALGAAADELNAALLDFPASPTVSVRLDGGQVRTDVRSAEPPPVAAEPRADDTDNSARISLRLPESLKAEIDAAAASEGISVNSWLVRAAEYGLTPNWRAAARMAVGWADSAARHSGDSAPRHGGGGQRVTGWING